MQSAVRNGRSFLGRVGGEEFLLLLTQADSQAAMALSTTLRTSLFDRPLLVEDKALVLSFSAGVVEVCHGQHDTSSLLTRADKALYAAKRSGRGKTVISVDYL